MAPKPGYTAERRAGPPRRRNGMPVETPSLFAQVIKDHLELKEQNSDLDRQMPIDRYKSADPFENHPLFKTEEQARLEETMDGVEPDFVAQSADVNLPWPGEETAEAAGAGTAVAVPDTQIEDTGFCDVDPDIVFTCDDSRAYQA